MPSRRTSEQTRELIQETALDLFLRHGYDVTTLEEIAGRLGITRPAILYHFHHKEQLLRSIVEPALDAIELALAAFPPEASPQADRQEEVVRALLSASLAHRQAVALMSRFTNEYGAAGLGERATANNQRCVDLLTGQDTADPAHRLKVVATLAALGGVMGARVFVPIETDDEVETLVRGLLAMLRA